MINLPPLRGRKDKSESVGSQLLGVGFTISEILQLEKEEATQEALEGKITPGMMRQPPPAVKSRPISENVKLRGLK